MTTARRTAPAWALALQVVTWFTLFAGDFWRDLVGWWGWLAIVVAAVIANTAWLLAARPRTGLRWWPKLLIAFVLWAALSLGWSHYRPETALAVLALLATATAAIAAALLLTWSDVLRVLGIALRIVVGLSALFELVVTFVIGHHIIPLVTVPGVDYTGDIPEAFYWSRNWLLRGGPIQGIVGNGDLLAMCAVLTLVVVGLQVADRAVRPGWGVFWLALSAAELVLTRSATALVVTAAVAVVLGFALWGRRMPPHNRWPLYGTAAVLVAAVAVGVPLLWNAFTTLLGKGADLTGRTGFWASVIDLAQQHPVVGWGWISYWAPWVEPFDGLATRNGVEYLQAHDAWLDVWMQLGAIGLAIFALLVLTTLGRSWFLAVDRPRSGLRDDEPYRAVSLLPLLVMTALVVQSATESRMLIESGLALLVLFAVRTKVRVR